MKALCGLLRIYPLAVYRSVDQGKTPPPVRTPDGKTLYRIADYEPMAQEQSERREYRARKGDVPRRSYFEGLRALDGCVHDVRTEEDKANGVPFDPMKSELVKAALADPAIMSWFAAAVQHAGSVVYDPDTHLWYGADKYPAKNCTVEETI